jgi:probable HAF family extracellular repeat protein
VLQHQLVQRSLVAAVALLSANACRDAAAPQSDDVLGDHFTDIGGLNGSNGSWALARSINSFGRVVGEAVNTRGQLHAFSWSSIGGIQDLGTFGGRTSSAAAINERSDIVGWAMNFSNTPRAFFYTFGLGMRDLTPAGAIGSEAYDINDKRTVVGRWLREDGSLTAFIWTESGGMKSLPMPQGFREARANGVNERNEITGYGIASNGARRGLFLVRCR